MKKTILLAIAILMFSACAQAANVEVVLDSGDGSSGIEIKNSNLARVATWDSTGAIAVKSEYGTGRAYNLGGGKILVASQKSRIQGREHDRDRMERHKYWCSIDGIWE